MIDVDQLRAKHISADNYDLGTEDIIAKLQEWDAKYGIEISDVKHDALTVRFQKVPEDTRPLAEEVYDFCPDTVDQGFGCFEEMLEMAEEMEQEIDPKITELVEGVDFDDEDYGVVLLARSIERDKTVGLWWD